MAEDEKPQASTSTAALFAMPSCASELDSMASAQPDLPASKLLTKASAEIRALRAALAEQASGSQTVPLKPPPEALQPLAAWMLPAQALHVWQKLLSAMPKMASEQPQEAHVGLAVPADARPELPRVPLPDLPLVLHPAFRHLLERHREQYGELSEVMHAVVSWKQAKERFANPYISDTSKADVEREEAAMLQAIRDYARAALAAARLPQQADLVAAGWLALCRGANGKLCAEHCDDEHTARVNAPYMSMKAVVLPCYVPRWEGAANRDSAHQLTAE